MEFIARVKTVEPKEDEPVTKQTNTEKAKSLLFEALRLLAEDDPTILIEAENVFGHKEKEVS